MAIQANFTLGASRRRPRLLRGSHGPSATADSLCGDGPAPPAPRCVAPVLPFVRSARACSTQCRNAVSVRSSSRATAPTVRPSSRTSRTAPALNSSVNCRRARLPVFCDPILAIVSALSEDVHETGSSSPSVRLCSDGVDSVPFHQPPTPATPRRSGNRPSLRDTSTPLLEKRNAGFWLFIHVRVSRVGSRESAPPRDRTCSRLPSRVLRHDCIRRHPNRDRCPVGIPLTVGSCKLRERIRTMGVPRSPYHNQRQILPEVTSLTGIDPASGTAASAGGGTAAIEPLGFTPRTSAAMRKPR